MISTLRLIVQSRIQKSGFELPIAQMRYPGAWGACRRTSAGKGITGTAADADSVTTRCEDRQSSSASTASNRTASSLRFCALTGGKNLLLR